VFGLEVQGRCGVLKVLGQFHWLSTPGFILFSVCDAENPVIKTGVRVVYVYYM